MKTSSQGRRVGITFLMVCLGVASVEAATTNSVPWSDSFETYSNGLLLQGTNGWSSTRPGAGLVTNAATQLDELTNTYHVINGHAYPLTAASHTNMVAVTDLLDNDILSSSGKVVVVDFTVMPTWCDINPPDNTNLQCAFYINTNQHVVIWHRNPTLATNEWLDLGAGTLVNTGAWTRFTMVQDYSNRMFQIRVNDGAPISNVGGYSAGGASANGPWFYMVQTNSLMSRATFGDGGTNYVDDFVVTNRSLSWSASGFRESITNNGSIDNTTPLTVTLRYDTFTGADGVFASSKYTVGNLPSNLTAVVTKTSDFSLSITVTGQALSNEVANSISSLTFDLLDSAFTLGSAASVDGAHNGNLALNFWNKGLLAYSDSRFQENAILNVGSFNSTLIITLANDQFTGDDGEDYATNSTKLNITGSLPAGLTGQVSKVSNTELHMTLLGNALAHGSANSTNFSLVFQAGAFASNVVAANVSNSTMSIAIQFADSPVLTYGTTTFTETPANDGTVTGTVVTLQFATFTGTDGNELAAGAVSAPNLPAGLYLHAIRANNGSEVVLVFSNQAAAHVSDDSRHNDVTVNFTDSAFVGGNAAGVVGASRSDLSIVFSNQPALIMASGLVFTEAFQNNGAIGNSLPITLTGDTFAPDLTGHYSVANVPSGLTAQLTRNNNNQVTLSLINNASPHTSAQSTNALQLTFSNEAFVTVAAANITGSTTNFSVSFNDAPRLAYSRGAFEERSMGTINNTAPLLITLTGDSFAANLTGRYSTSNVPEGLTVSITRDSATQLSMSLMGTAAAHASGNTITDLMLTFQQGAFVNADANQVVNIQTNFSVVFMDDTSFVNTVPYEEPFEVYPNGFLLAGTNAWTADFYADAAQVTNDASMISKLAVYAGSGTLPIQTAHTQTLLVRDCVRTEIHSPTGQLVYLDFMSYPAPMTETPSNDTNLQYAFYVSTNLQMVIWHCNTTGGSPTNEWLALTNSPLINTSCWNRFTVAQDYTNHMFQLRVNEGTAIVDPAGWSQGGASRTGSWFHMVQTNSLMSRLIISGIGTTYLDDFTVRTSLAPGFGLGVGTVYMIR